MSMFKKTFAVSSVTLFVMILFFVFCGGEGTPDYCPAGEPYNSNVEFCGEDGRAHEKCNGQTYSTDTQFCNDRIVYDRCGGRTYNPVTQFCWVADGTIWPLCEGGLEYNPHTEGCSDNLIKERCGRSLYDPATEFCHGGTLVYDRCNGMAFNPSAGCNGMEVQPKCRNIYFNPDVQFCWEDRTYNLCNGQEYDPADGDPCATNIDMVTVVSDGVGATGGGRYAVGATVRINAGTHPENALFLEWRTDNPDVTFDNARSVSTSFVMPASAVTVTAVFNVSGMVDCDTYNSETHLCDTRDGKIYRFVTIGTQTWMAENLNFQIAGSLCHQNDPNCEIYGRSYDWVTTMGLPSTCDFDSCRSQVHQAQPPLRGICPEGWHVPDETEWRTLVNFVGDTATAGWKLKSTSGWDDYKHYVWNNDENRLEFEIRSGNGTDDFGFSALPGSIMCSQCAIWWSTFRRWEIRGDRGSVVNLSRTENHLSVRCVRD